MKSDNLGWVASWFDGRWIWDVDGKAWRRPSLTRQRQARRCGVRKPSACLEPRTVSRLHRFVSDWEKKFGD